MLHVVERFFCLFNDLDIKRNHRGLIVMGCGGGCGGSTGGSSFTTAVKPPTKTTTTYKTSDVSPDYLVKKTGEVKPKRNIV